MGWWCVNPFHSTKATKTWRVRRWWTKLFLEPNTLLVNCTLWPFYWSYKLLLASFVKQYIGLYGRATWPAFTYHIGMDCKFVDHSCCSDGSVAYTWAHYRLLRLICPMNLCSWKDLWSALCDHMIANIFGKAIHCTNCMTEQRAWMLHTVVFWEMSLHSGTFSSYFNS